MTPKMAPKAAARRRGGARGKVIGGGLIVAGLLFIGSWLGGKGLFPGGSGFGLGGSGDGDGQANVNTVASTDTDKRTAPEKVEPKVGSVVNVLIDGDEYRLLNSPGAAWTDSSNYTEVPLERIVNEAEQAEGDSGVKVRVARRGTAIPQAEDKLIDALQAAGIPETAIEWRDVEIP